MVLDCMICCCGLHNLVINSVFTLSAPCEVYSFSSCAIFSLLFSMAGSHNSSIPRPLVGSLDRGVDRTGLFVSLEIKCEERCFKSDDGTNLFRSLLEQPRSAPLITDLNDYFTLQADAMAPFKDNHTKIPSRNATVLLGLPRSHDWPPCICHDAPNLLRTLVHSEMGFFQTVLHAHNLRCEFSLPNLIPNKCWTNHEPDKKFIVSQPLFLNLAVADFLQALGLMHNCEPYVFLFSIQHAMICDSLQRTQFLFFTHCKFLDLASRRKTLMSCALARVSWCN